MVYDKSPRSDRARVPGPLARARQAPSPDAPAKRHAAPQAAFAATSGFSLTESVISLAILALLVLGLMAGAVTARRSAEATVHTALADAVSTGFLEQLRSMQYASLLEEARDNGSVSLEIEDGTVIEVPLNAETFFSIQVPIDAGASGVADRFLDYSVRPQVVVGAEDRLLTLVIDYRWRTPTDPRERAHRLALSRSAVPQL